MKKFAFAAVLVSFAAPAFADGLTDAYQQGRQDALRFHRDIEPRGPHGNIDREPEFWTERLSRIDALDTSYDEGRKYACHSRPAVIFSRGKKSECYDVHFAAYAPSKNGDIPLSLPLWAFTADAAKIVELMGDLRTFAANAAGARLEVTYRRFFALSSKTLEAQGAPKVSVVTGISFRFEGRKKSYSFLDVDRVEKASPPAAAPKP